MQKRVVRWLYCVPPQAAQIENTIAKYYVALRLGLTRRVRMITSANPSTLVNLARLGNEEKESLIRDIFDGSLTDRYPVPDFVRQALGRKIRRPNPRCAEKLEAIVNQTGTLYPKDYWPELALLGNWTAGSVGAYLRHYPKYFGDATIRDLGLLASEGRMTIVVDDNTPSGVLDVGTHFYEFIPEEEIDSPQPTVLLAHELEAGKSYYILLTTSYGFCRYNIFDLVRVTGWYNKTPLLEFLNKGAHFSSITGEKLSEFQVSRAMIATLEELDTTLTGYALAPCWDDEQPYYGLFLERGDLGGIRNAGRITEIMDRHLRRLNIEYDGKRASQRLGMIRAELLPTGEWTRWNARRLQQTGGTAEQYKQPCLISDHTFREQMPVEEELEPESELVAV